MNDSLAQTYIVAIAIHLAGIGIADHLWTENRAERFLQFWTLAWTAGLVRWLLHYPWGVGSPLRTIEVLFISLTMFFMVLGSYDVIPGKPWKQRFVVGATALVFLAYGVVASMMEAPLVLGYSLFAAVLAFVVGCMWVAFRATGLPGYVFAAATCLWQFVLVGVMLVDRGEEIANSIIVPLYNLPLILSIVVIAHQRDRRQLVASERTLQKIFDTAPTPIIIVRPPGDEIERANRVAFEMLGIAPEAAIGGSAVEHGLLHDVAVRRRLSDELALGRRVHDQEAVMLRAGESRTVSINADRIVLASGDRYIYSFYDLTELRRAESELRASAAETRRLYIRLAHVEDDERRALHAELHDQVGANLSALRLELDVAASLLSRDDGSSAERHLRGAREVAAETIAMVRDLMAGLRPPALDDFGLVAALRTLAESQSSRLGLEIDVSGDDVAPRPGPLVESALFRIAQEAVVNAARHASATRVAVEIAERDGRVILTIGDDGVGFDLEAPGAGPDHWGLKSMRERASAIGGSLHVETVPGAGTRVTADVPLEAA